MDFLQKLPDTVCVRKSEKRPHFRAHYLFWPKHFLGPKTVQTRKNCKNSGFSGNCPKPKTTPLFWKKVFSDMGEQVGFTNCVFEKLCFAENTIFIMF